MARSSDNNEKKDGIYDQARKFLDVCLVADGSLLFEGEDLWRPELLTKLYDAFVATPDVSDRSFMDKFKDQIGGAGTEVIKLAAEVLGVYFLFPSSVGAARKRELVTKVLGWANTELRDTAPLLQAFSSGIGSGGQGYNTRRPFEIAYLIELARALKKLPEPDRRSTASSAWKFMDLADSVEDAGSRQLRHMILHLLFPHEFERIASGNHKRRVLRAFAELVDEDALDDDRALLLVRGKLEKLLPGRVLDFYREPLSEAWYVDAEDVSEGMPLEILQYKKQIVLYGPPGTGKTFRAKQLANTIIKAGALKAMGASAYFQSQDVIAQATKTNVRRLQLHPAYSYEDFIRALHISSSGQTEYRLGFLPLLVSEMAESKRSPRLPYVLILDEMNRTDLSRMLGECFSLLEDRNETVDLPARDSDGLNFTLSIPDDLYIIGTMNLIDQSIEQIDFALRRRFLWLLCPFDADALLSAAEGRWRALAGKLSWDKVADDFRKLANAAAALNREIHQSSHLGPQYEVGHTYFLDVVVFLRDFLGDRPNGKKYYLWNGKGEAREPVTQIWDLSIRPLLDQYLAGLDAAERAAEIDRLHASFLKPVA